MVAACLIAGAIVYPHLPSLVVSHWNAHGLPDGSMTRLWGILALPLIMLVLIGLWAVLPALDPSGGIKRFRYIYDFFWFIIIAFFAYVYALSLWSNLGMHVDFLRALIPALALLFFILGSLMPYTKRNWYFGIRTPWTLSSDRVWDKTHEFGGHLIQIAALLILIGTFTQPVITVWLIAGPLVLAALISVVYSYFIYKSEERHPL
jgi:uncharacterized membrane protein